MDVLNIMLQYTWVNFMDENESESKEAIDEKMCVLRSLTSVVKSFTQEEVGPDPQMIKKRLDQIKVLEARMQQKYEEEVKEWEKTGRKLGGLDIIKLSHRIHVESELEDHINIKEFIDSLLIDKENRGSLARGLRGLVVEYKTTASVLDLIRSLRDPDNQVCIRVAGHFMHVGLSEKTRLVSLSDLDASGNPAFLGMSMFKSFGKSGDNNMIIFTKAENAGKTS